MNFALTEEEPQAASTTVTISGGPLELSYTEMQDKVFSDPHRFVVFAKGRRFGGTIGAANCVIETMLSGGQKVLWVDTIQGNLAKYFQRYFVPILKQIDRQYWSWNESKKELKILDSFMDMRSAERPENIEGFFYSMVVLNEVGHILKNRYLWDNCIRPMTLDLHAKCFFVGTPKGKRDKTGQEHLYYTFFKRGQDPVAFPDWKSFVATSYQNPFLSKEDIVDLEKEVPAIISRQEIHAEFIDISEDSVFRDEWWKIVDSVPVEASVVQKIISIDTAFKDRETNDFSCGLVWQRTHEAYYIVDMFMERLTFPDLITKVESVYATWLPDIVLVEDKASGQSLVQMFQRTTMPVVPFKVDSDKVTRAIAITPLIEQGKVFLVKGSWNKTLVDQCAVFPQGEFDDACFVAGTLIATPLGDRPIETLKIGDRVLTPVGVRKVTKIYVSNADKVITKFGLTGTPSHPILYSNNFEKMDALTLTLGLHILGAWKTILWSLTHALYLKENPTSKLVGKAIITTIASIIPQNTNTKKWDAGLLVGLWKRYTTPYGKKHTIEKYPLAIWYTISMVIQIITILLTYSFYCLGNIMLSLRASAPTLKKNTLKVLGRLLLLGTSLMKVETGTKNTQKKHGQTLQVTKNKNPNHVYAFSAVQTSCPTNQVVNTAHITVPKSIYTPTTIKKSQLYAGIVTNPSKLSIEEKTLPRFAPSPAEATLPSPPFVVYNLEIDYAHCYYANKILVGNCDALSMGLNYMKNYAPLSSSRVPIKRKIVRTQSDNMRGY